MWKTSAYIDINAWKAGIAQRPEDYEWCSFAAAVKGDEKARRGYAFMYGNADDWDVIQDSHEKSMREAMSEILTAREAERAEREAKGELAPGRRKNPPPSKADPGLDAPRRFALELERGDPAVVERILALLSDGPTKPAALREAVGIKSRIHFNRYYLAPMLEVGRPIAAATSGYQNLDGFAWIDWTRTTLPQGVDVRVEGAVAVAAPLPAEHAWSLGRRVSLATTVPDLFGVVAAGTTEFRFPDGLVFLQLGTPSVLGDTVKIHIAKDQALDYTGGMYYLTKNQSLPIRFGFTTYTF